MGDGTETPDGGVNTGSEHTKPEDPIWDAGQYGRFRSERARPFHDLLARVGERPVRSIADVGCGDGTLTGSLLERWPGADVWGIDSSKEMLARALGAPAPEGLHFLRADLRRWRPPAPIDLVLSNAVLHWVPDHAQVLATLAGWLGPEGTLAVQIPNNRSEPAYRAIEALADEEPWSERLRGVNREVVVESPAFYHERLEAHGLETDLWETIYYHRLVRSAEIVEWLKGTTLRPILSALSEEEAARFLAELSARVAPLYPENRDGVLFPFRRLFFVARRRPAK